MQYGRNCHKHIWLLSGTGEGPSLAKALISKGFKVTVSVVSLEASLAYEGILLEDLKIGSIAGSEGVIEFLKESEFLKKRFDWVIDATHPFAEVISCSLKNACQELEQPLLRYERPFEDTRYVNLINDIDELASLDLSDQKLLIAIGSRHLKQAVLNAKKAGAKVYARVFPTSENLRNALRSSIPSSDIAMIRPESLGSLGDLEIALCEKWNITGIVCRQSGGKIEKLWREVSYKKNLKLWLILRPKYSEEVETINNYEELLHRLLETSSL